MFKGLFFAVLFATLLVNLVFLFATKDKPPDISSAATLQTILKNDVDYNQQHQKQPQQHQFRNSERILVQRSNNNNNNEAFFGDYPAPFAPNPGANANSHSTTINMEKEAEKVEDSEDDKYDKSNVELSSKQKYSDNKLNERSQVEHQKRSIVLKESVQDRDLKNASESRRKIFASRQNVLDDDGSADANDATINIRSTTQIPTPTQNSSSDRKANANSSHLDDAKQISSPLNDDIDRTVNINSSQEQDEARKKQTTSSRGNLMQMKLFTNNPRPQNAAKTNKSSSSETTLRVEYRISEEVSSSSNNSNNKNDKNDKNDNVIYSAGLDNDDPPRKEKSRVRAPATSDEYYVSTNNKSSNFTNTKENDNDRIKDINDDPDRDLNTNSNTNANANRWLDIRVKSSRNHVFVSVDGGIIYESKSSVSQQKLQQIDASRQAAHYLTRPAINNNNNDNGHLVVVPNGEFMEDFEPEAGRGIHVIVLNEFNGNVMSKRLYDTYSHNQDKELSFFLSMIRDGRIIIFAIKDEASFNMPAESPARKLLSNLGCKQVMSLRWRDMWACVTRKRPTLEGGQESILGSIRTRHDNFAEGLSKSPSFSDWAPAVLIETRIELLEDPDPNMSRCHALWRAATANSSVAELERRREFCSKIDGYGRVCDCSFPSPISFQTRTIASSQIEQVPIIVIAGNRPYYLQRMLRSLLSADGINPQMVTVFIDGFYEEPRLVSELFNLRAVHHRPQGRRGARISHHYKSSLTRTFERFPQAEFAIIFEEDLDVAQDALLYFNQTMGLLRNDESLYCVSAWNDQGYEHTVGDSRMLYRIETMPGLGWMLKRDLYKRELEPVWPSTERAHDWDMWIRMDSIRRGRECIIPDISRTYHFGSTGTNINAHFQSLYFSKHAINMSPLKPNGSEKFWNLETISPVQVYENQVEKLISQGEVIRASADHICQLAKRYEHVESVKNETETITSAVIYIKMIDKRDYRNWLKLASCWKIWDLDARGQHRSTWRLYVNGVKTFVVGHPASRYSFLKPADVEPIDFNYSQ